MSKVFANLKSIVHKGDGLVHSATAPNVCKIQGPGGVPIPVPFGSVSKSADLAEGTTSVRVSGTPAAIENSKIAKSSGDEAGKLGGVVSNKNGGAMKWLSASPDVKFEGKPVVRYMDLALANGNTFNTVGEADGEQAEAQPRLRVRVQVQGVDVDGVLVTATLQAGGDVVTRTTGDGAGAGVADLGIMDAGTWRITALDGDANGRDGVIYPQHVDVVLGDNDDLEEVIEVEPVVRVPLGHQVPDVDDQTWVRFYLPRLVGSGGQGNGHIMKLHLDVTAGQLEYYGTNPADPAIQAFGPGGQWHTPPAQGGGWHYARVTGAQASVTVWLYEQAFARDGAAHNAAALIPWNFYFWSLSRLMAPAANTPVAFLDAADADNGSGRSPFQQFDQAFGLGTTSFDWESDPAHDGHNDLARAQPNPLTWQGHCNWMGAASILFAPPDDVTGPNNVDFDAEDLKLLTAEYAANNTDSNRVWDLGAYNLPLQMTQSAIHAVPNHTAPAPGAAAWRQAQATNDRPLLGRIALDLFAVLRTEMGAQGHPLLLDMRSKHNAENPRASSDEVWNQAAFHYAAWYSEHPSATNDHVGDRRAQDLRIELTLNANADQVLPTLDPPATFQGGDVNIEAPHWAREYVFRFQYTNNGDPAVNDPLNSWDACTAGGAACFLPRYLSRINGVLAQPADGGGNPHVTWARLGQLGITRRARY